ncbi:MAG TPA: 3-methyl-2-oxobutanoate hydroxymethyltransferase, partial [Ruminococcaceae bacterium]|nr:3-methyl-2-oxobutanoate hydroxymethyltransferase [Oscillospiraceae bacterium]
MNKKCTAQSLLTKKINHEKISMLTSYDYSMAKIVDQAGIDVILVGDSLGMVIQGHDSTLPVSVNDMVYHCRCVSKGIKHALLVGDLPFLSYHISTEEAVRNAGKIIQEGRATAVKLEGGKNVADCIQAITRAQIPVMGHIGLTPQSVNVFGGFKVQGKSTEAAKALIEDALAVENAGAFAIVLECVPEE